MHQRYQATRSALRALRHRIRISGTFSRRLILLAPTVLVLIGMAGSVGGWRLALRDAENELHRAFREETEAAVDGITRSIERYLDMLGNMQAFFAASTNVSRLDFHRYVSGLEASRQYPALRALQYAPLVRLAELAEFERGVRSDRTLHSQGYPAYAVHPPGIRTYYVPVLYNEPMRSNEAAFGHDQVAEPARRELMERSRDRGVPQASPPLQLVQDAARAPTVIVRAPIFGNGERPSATTQRDRAFVGQVSALVSVTEMVRAMVSQPLLERTRIRIDDVGYSDSPIEPGTAARLVFLGQPSVGWRDGVRTLARQEMLDFGGRTWQLRFERQIETANLYALPNAILVAGMAGSLCLAMLLVWLIRGRHAAVQAGERLTRELHRSEQELRAMIDSVQEIVCRTDPHGHILFVNPAWHVLTGYSVEESLGRPLLDFIHPSDVQSVRSAARAALRAQPPDIDWTARLVTNVHVTRWVHARARFLGGTGSEPLHAVGTLVDVTERVAAEHAARQEALLDPLTRLPNRVKAIERLHHAIELALDRGHWVGVLFIDLNQFKSINDTHGHAIGDGVLQAVSARLRATVRADDTVARVGGDEFVVILPNILNAKTAERVSHAIAESLHHPIRCGALTLHVSASVGIGLFPQDGANAADLIAMADQAMYRDKRSPRTLEQPER